MLQPFRDVRGIHPDVKHPQHAVGQRAARSAEGHFLLPGHGLPVQGAVRVAVNEFLVLVKRIRRFLAGLIEFCHSEPGLGSFPGKGVLFHHAPVFFNGPGEIILRFLCPGFLHQGNRLLIHHTDGSGGGGASEEHWHRASAPETAAIMRNSFFTFMILQQKKKARQSGERRLTRKRS